MITDELTYRIREALGLEPTAEQNDAIGYPITKTYMLGLNINF